MRIQPRSNPKCYNGKFGGHEATFQIRLWNHFYFIDSSFGQILDYLRSLYHLDSALGLLIAINKWSYLIQFIITVPKVKIQPEECCFQHTSIGVNSLLSRFIQSIPFSKPFWAKKT
jgi:hypothetical protein